MVNYIIKKTSTCAGTNYRSDKTKYNLVYTCYQNGPTVDPEHDHPDIMMLQPRLDIYFYFSQSEILLMFHASKHQDHIM